MSDLWSSATAERVRRRDDVACWRVCRRARRFEQSSTRGWPSYDSTTNSNSTGTSTSSTDCNITATTNVVDSLASSSANVTKRGRVLVTTRVLSTRVDGIECGARSSRLLCSRYAAEIVIRCDDARRMRIRAGAVGLRVALVLQRSAVVHSLSVVRASLWPRSICDASRGSARSTRWQHRRRGVAIDYTTVACGRCIGSATVC